MLIMAVNNGHDQRGWKFNWPACIALLFILLAPVLLKSAELKPESVKAWDAYLRAAKMRIEERARGQTRFLWVDENPERVRRVRAGEVLVEPVGGFSPHDVPHGLIHDWVGAVFVPQANLRSVMDLLDDYDQYKDFYRPMVAKAKLLEQTHDGDDEHEKISLLMTQRAYSVVAAVETENEVEIESLGAGRAYSLSTSVRVREIADYGTGSQRELPEGRGPGYVWRTFTVTRLEQRDGGVFAEMEMVAMSRSIPLAFRWLVQPMAEHLAQNVLLAMLQDTRNAVNLEVKTASLKNRKH